jgi:hypothetical protein
MAVVVATDDLNTWAAAHTDFVFRVTSTVAALDPEASRARLAAWPDLLRGLGLLA